MDKVGNFVNHLLVAHLRVVGKEWHRISSGDCWRPSVVLKVLRWSWGSLRPLNGSSWGNRNFDGTGQSRIAVVKGESVALIILYKLQFVFSLMAFLNSSISFLLSLEEFCSSGVVGPRWSLLLWLSPSSSWWALDRFSFCWSHSFISWFCLVSSSMMATRAWTCWVKAVESWLDSIWIQKLVETTFSNLSTKMSSPQTVPNWWSANSSVEVNASKWSQAFVPLIVELVRLLL